MWGLWWMLYMRNRLWETFVSLLTLWTVAQGRLSRLTDNWGQKAGVDCKRRDIEVAESLIQARGVGTKATFSKSPPKEMSSVHIYPLNVQPSVVSKLSFLLYQKSPFRRNQLFPIVWHSNGNSFGLSVQEHWEWYYTEFLLIGILWMWHWDYHDKPGNLLIGRVLLHGVIRCTGL